jgi:hypothetical protein
MDACVRRTRKDYYYQGSKATRHTYFPSTTGLLLAPCFQRLASGSSRAICEAPPQVMIVRPRCAWCMEACCLFFPLHASWYLAVACPVLRVSAAVRHPHNYWTYLAAPLRCCCGCSRRQPVKSAHAYQTHGVLRLSRSSSVCVSRCQIQQSRPDQTKPAIGGAMIIGSIR